MRNYSRELWWWVRGVKGTYYRQSCARCGLTGQTHYSLRSMFHCLRFKPFRNAHGLDWEEKWLTRVKS